MIRTRLSRGLAAVGISVAVAATVAATATAATGQSPGASTGPATPAAPARTVHLVTGDTVSVRTSGGRTLLAAAGTSPAGGRLRTITAGPHRYAFPAAAAFYLGRFLDPALFDVSASAAATSDRVPLRITAPAGTTVPGVTVTGRSGTTETGYVTASSGAAFGAALLKQFQHDTAAGAGAPTALLGATRIALDGTGSAAHPDYPQQTLTVNAVGANGKPLSEGIGLLVNTDNLAKLDTLVFVVNGVAKVSVPLGHYSAILDAESFTATSFVDRLVVAPDFTVTASGGAVTLDARQATARPSVSTPKPADTSGYTLEWDRTDAAGNTSGFSFGYDLLGTDTAPPVFISPTPAPVIGLQRLLSQWHLVDPAGGSAYTYDLSFLYAGAIPADLHNSATAANLATVASRYYTDGPSRHGLFDRFAFYPFQLGVFSTFYDIDAPLARTEYVSGGGTEVWQDSFIQNSTDANPFAGEIDDNFRSYSPGQVRLADWARGPLGAGVQADTPGNPFYYCHACRNREHLVLLLTPVVDSTPGHGGYLDETAPGQDVAQFTLFENGKQVASRPDSVGGEFPVSRDATTYRFVLSTDRRPGGFVGSTRSTLDETFVSSGDDRAPMPSGWACFVAGRCTVLPLLQADVPLPESLTDRLPVGKSTITFSISHIQGAAASAITSAGLSTSTDGTTWTAAPVMGLGGGRYSAVVDNTTPGAGVSLRVTAKDAVGGILTQTTTNAYFVAGS